MEVVYPRCAGLDIHKKKVVACRLLPVSRLTANLGLPASLAPLPLQEFLSYYEQVRRHSPRRYSIPHGFGRLGRSLLAPQTWCQYRGMPSHVPRGSSRSGSRCLYAGHRLANQRAPARLVPGLRRHPGFDVVS